MLKTKLWVFLKQTQPKIKVNQHVSTMCMGVEGNQENQQKKTKEILSD